MTGTIGSSEQAQRYLQLRLGAAESNPSGGDAGSGCHGEMAGNSGRIGRGKEER